MSFLSVTRKAYLPSSGAPGISPAYDAMWDDTSAADRRAAVWDAKSSTSFATLTPSWTFALAPGSSRNVLVRQYVLPTYGSIAAQMQAPGSTTPPEQAFAPVARMLVSATRGGSAISYGNYHFVTWMCAKVVDSSGVLRWVIGRSGTGSAPGLAHLTAREWTVAYLSGSNLLLPSSTDHLVWELGFRLDNGGGGGTVVYSLSLEFGDSATFDLSTGSALQGNAHGQLSYYVLNASNAAAPRILKPLAPMCPAKTIQFPSVPDRAQSDRLNDLVLN